MVKYNNWALDTQALHPRLQWRKQSNGYSPVRSRHQSVQIELDGKHDPDLILDARSKFWLFGKELGSCCRGRKLDIVQGGMLCLVPSTTLVGDLITVLDGCQVPIVLRQFGASFRVVGDCYVHGIMYGEAINGGGIVFKEKAIPSAYGAPEIHH
ncbi:hypothetical protein CI102_14836 [Trichoderma harzianum]|nr:hypothetical protein CI102_14836 [Trichoderma harzianum]